MTAASSMTPHPPTMSRHVHFSETHRFRQRWLWALLVVGAVPGALLAGAAVVVDSPGPWTDQAPLLALIAGLVVGPLVLLWRAGLRVEVDGDGLAVRFWPFHWSARRVSCEEVAAVAEIEVSAVADFGGVGVRWNVSPSREGLVRVGPKGYVARSGPGVRVERREKRDLVVTVDDAEGLVAAIERACGTPR